VSLSQHFDIFYYIISVEIHNQLTDEMCSP